MTVNINVKTAPCRNLLDIIREPVFDVNICIKDSKNEEFDEIKSILMDILHKNTYVTKEIINNDEIILKGKTSRRFGREYDIKISNEKSECEIEINAPAALTYNILNDLSNIVEIDKKIMEEVSPPSGYTLPQEPYLF